MLVDEKGLGNHEESGYGNLQTQKDSLVRGRISDSLLMLWGMWWDELFQGLSNFWPFLDFQYGSIIKKQPGWKEWNLAICSSMDEPEVIMLNKSARKTQIPYDHTYM